MLACVPYIVMPYMANGSLLKCLKKPLSGHSLHGSPTDRNLLRFGQLWDCVCRRLSPVQPCVVLRRVSSDCVSDRNSQPYRRIGRPKDL